MQRERVRTRYACPSFFPPLCHRCRFRLWTLRMQVWSPLQEFQLQFHVGRWAAGRRCACCLVVQVTGPSAMYLGLCGDHVQHYTSGQWSEDPGKALPTWLQLQSRLLLLLSHTIRHFLCSENISAVRTNLGAPEVEHDWNGSQYCRTDAEQCGSPEYLRYGLAFCSL